MKQLKFKGFSLETEAWHYGHGWFNSDYTEEYLKAKGIEQQAVLYTEGYPIECNLSSIGQFTELKDKNELELYTGDHVKIPCNTNKELHGDYTIHEILKVNGQFITSYLSSETGEKLPKGYVRGFLLDHYEYTPKLFLWSNDYIPYTEIEKLRNKRAI